MPASLLIALLLWAFASPLGALANCPDAPSYEGTVTLDAGSQFVMKHRRVKSNTIMELKLSIANIGWMGVGLSETGYMLGSDVAVIYNPTGTGYVYDAHVDWVPSPVNSTYVPLPDPTTDMCQDWTLVCYSESNGVTQAIIQRALDTGDSQDRPITSGSLHVVYAWSTSSSPSYHGANRGSTLYTFFGTSTAFSVPADATSSVDLIFSGQNTSTTMQTQYICQGFDLGTTDQHVVALEPLVTGSTLR